MKNFFEWCKDKGLSLEACHKEPVRAGKKMPGEKGDTNVYRGGTKQYNTIKGYKGNFSVNGTIDPLELNSKSGSGKPVADIGK